MDGATATACHDQGATPRCSAGGLGHSPPVPSGDKEVLVGPQGMEASRYRSPQQPHDAARFVTARLSWQSLAATPEPAPGAAGTSGLPRARCPWCSPPAGTALSPGMGTWPRARHRQDRADLGTGTRRQNLRLPNARSSASPMALGHPETPREPKHRVPKTPRSQNTMFWKQHVNQNTVFLKHHVPKLLRIPNHCTSQPAEHPEAPLIPNHRASQSSVYPETLSILNHCSSQTIAHPKPPCIPNHHPSQNTTYPKPLLIPNQRAS